MAFRIRPVFFNGFMPPFLSSLNKLKCISNYCYQLNIKKSTKHLALRKDEGEKAVCL